MSDDQTETPERKGASVRVRYEETTVGYASQFLANVTAEDVIINFASGYLTDPGSGENILPIQRRIAMSHQGAQRLIAVLQQALSSARDRANRPAAEAETPTNIQ
jgi:hypothetical protein